MNDTQDWVLQIASEYFEVTKINIVKLSFIGFIFLQIYTLFYDIWKKM